MTEVGVSSETDIKPLCKFYKKIYKRMVIWFGFTYPFWLSDMDQHELLKCILRMVMSPNMYTIFINVAVRIRSNNDRDVDVLLDYKRAHPNINRNKKRQQYYADNIERLREYNKNYQQLKKICSINLFKKNTSVLS